MPIRSPRIRFRRIRGPTSWFRSRRPNYYVVYTPVQSSSWTPFRIFLAAFAALVVLSLICDGVAWVVTSMDRLLTAAEANASVGLSALVANPPLGLLLGFAAGAVIASAVGFGVWMVFRRRT